MTLNSRGEHILIWWLDQRDLEAIDKHGIPTWFPGWLTSEIQSANGLPGRGRLWVADEVGPAPHANFDDEVGSAIETRARQCAGIVITRSIVPRLIHMPGFVTDFDVCRWESEL